MPGATTTPTSHRSSAAGAPASPAGSSRSSDGRAASRRHPARTTAEDRLAYRRGPDGGRCSSGRCRRLRRLARATTIVLQRRDAGEAGIVEQADAPVARSEEHTSELQSRENLVCRLLLEKK